MSLATLNLLFAILGIAFALGAGLSALAALIHVQWDHGFQRRLDVAYMLFAGAWAWGSLTVARQSFDRASDPHFQSTLADGLGYIVLISWALLSLGLLLISIRRIGVALRRLQAKSRSVSHDE